MNNALASTEDVLDFFPDEAISACAAIRSLHCATRNGGELIKSELGVGHWFEGVVEGCPPSMNTPSLESMAEVMTCIKQCCDLAYSAWDSPPSRRLTSISFPIELETDPVCRCLLCRSIPISHFDTDDSFNTHVAIGITLHQGYQGLIIQMDFVFL